VKISGQDKVLSNRVLGTRLPMHRYIKKNISHTCGDVFILFLTLSGIIFFVDKKLYYNLSKNDYSKELIIYNLFYIVVPI